ncbi:MAG: type II toxin-antitoxin system VapC family toxin [Luteolibacter sp.]
MRFLLDIAVISEGASKAPNEKVLRWLEENSAECALSVLSLGEVWKGIQLLPEGSQKDSLSAWIEGVTADFASVTLSLDVPVMKVWAKMSAQHDVLGVSLTLVDSLLAATAIHHGLTLVTRSAKGFPSDVPLLNPWE